MCERNSLAPTLKLSRLFIKRQTRDTSSDNEQQRVVTSDNE